MVRKKKYGIYQVGLKLLLRRQDGKVLLLHLKNGEIDLPGGRIDNIEYRKPIEKILAREISEELGRNVKYTLGHVAFQYHFPYRKGGIFITVFEGNYISGEIKLSFEHKSYTWENLKDFKFAVKNFPMPVTYFGFKKYFQKHHG